MQHHLAQSFSQLSALVKKLVSPFFQKTLAGRAESGSLLLPPISHDTIDQSDFMRLFVRHERDLRVFARGLLPNWPAVDDVLREASVAEV